MERNKEIASFCETYRYYFLIGTCLEPYDLKPYKDILIKHFNSFTAENCMKPAHLQPEEGKFAFEKADKIIKFARRYEKKVRGHTLVWHNQTPNWFFESKDGNTVSKEVLLKRMENHIKTVVKHFADDVYCWDVVNEAVADQGTDLYRQSNWYNIAGEDFMELAFKYAAEAAPESTALFYNDYNAVQPAKREKIISLLKSLIDKDIPVDGVGIQGHWNIENYSVENLKIAIEKYAKLGLDIHITELDNSMFAFGDKRKITAPTEEMQDKQNKMYREIFAVFREYSNLISNVTFWGIADDNTWLDNFPVKNRKNWPLLFDVNRQPKNALVDIINDA